MKIHLETHELPISKGYSASSRADGTIIEVYCGRCGEDYPADAHWARRYMARIRTIVDRELAGGYISTRARAATIEMHEKNFERAGLLRDDSQADKGHPCAGCGADRGPDRLLCDDCWNRLPARLPIGPDGSLVTWRRRIKQARRTGHWGDGSIDIIIAIRTWLVDHPPHETAG